MTEESIAGMTDKMHQMERDIMALSKRVSAPERSEYQETAMEPRHLERGDCEKSLAELLSRLESISAEMVRSETAEQLKADGESLRKDLDAQLRAELTLVQRVESMERTIQWLSEKPANETTELELVDSQCEITAKVKERLPDHAETSIETTVECKETRQEGNSNFQFTDGASGRARRSSSSDVKKDYFGPLPLRPRSKSIGRLPVDKVRDEPQRHLGEPLEASPTREQSSSPPRKEPLGNLLGQQRPKKKMLSKRRSMTNKITGLSTSSTDPLPSGDGETDPSVTAAEPKSLKRPGLAAASKKALIDVNQFPERNSSSSTSSLPPSPPEGRLNKSKTFVAEKNATLKRGKGITSDNKEFRESFQETINESDSKKREVRKRKPRLKSHTTRNAPPSEDVPRGRGKDKERGERSSGANEVPSVGDWDCQPPEVDGPTSRKGDSAAEGNNSNETEPRPSRRHNLERQKRRQSGESEGNPHFRRHKRISSKGSDNSSSCSSGEASTVRKQTGSDARSPPTCVTAAEDRGQKREGQPGQQGVVRAAVEAVARTVLGAAAVAAGVGSPKFQASVDSKVTASSSSSPHESCNDQLASDIPAGTAESAKVDGKQLARKPSKSKLAEKKQSASSESHKSEDNANQSCPKPRKSSEGSDEWKVTISSKEDVSVLSTSSGQTVVVTPKKAEKAEMAKPAAIKPRPKKGGGISSEKVAKRQRSRADLIPKPGQYPAARPPRDHKPAAKPKVPQEKEVMPEIITSADQVNKNSRRHGDNFILRKSYSIVTMRCAH